MSDFDENDAKVAEAALTDAVMRLRSVVEAWLSFWAVPNLWRPEVIPPEMARNALVSTWRLDDAPCWLVIGVRHAANMRAQTPKRKRPDRPAIRAPCVTIARQPPWMFRGQRPQSPAASRTRPKGQCVRTATA